MAAVHDSRWHLAAVLVLYCALALAVQIHCIDLLTSDGECYLRIAVYVAHGDFHHAIFGHWSPLGPWLTAPLVAAGMVPRYAFRLMIGLWGALAVYGAWRLAGRLGLNGAWRTLATACSAVLAAEFSAAHRVDLLVAALLLRYADAVMDERLLASRRWAARVGAIGGLAYLAKLYALPFFALHYTLMVLAHGWAAVGRANLHAEPALNAESAGARAAPRRLGRAMAGAWIVGVAAFALVAEPWVMTLSLKYGRLTFGTAAAQTYDQFFGPGAEHARQLAITGLRKPPPDVYNVWADSRFDLPASTKSASPFRSWAAFAEQMATVWRNVGVMLPHFTGIDRFRLGVAALALTPLAFLATLRRRETAFRHLAVALTIGLFCGGYAFIHADEERFFWFPLLVVPLVAFQFVALAARAARRLMPRMRERPARLLAAGLGLLAAASFADRASRNLGELFSAPPLGREHRLVARQIAQWGVQGPLAATDWHDGLHTAYYLDAQYAGMPAAQTPDRIVVEMRAEGAKTLLAWAAPPIEAACRTEPALRLVGVIPAASLAGLKGDVAVFELRD